jgi:hypothetical protein
MCLIAPRSSNAVALSRSPCEPLRRYGKLATRSLTIVHCLPEVRIMLHQLEI